ncbi:MAG: helix-turn-helix domain-containing protein [Parabacteroides sp.]|jgi:excisionase family DNA binding protein|nr:helix-turn-helix domain-containing protein [Parabacteroides sp.]
MKDFDFFNTIERLEELKDIVTKLEDLEQLYQKVHSMELFFNRFKKHGELIMHLQKIEKSTYMLKEFFHMDEAAEYLGITKAHLYKLTASNRIACYKPGGKQIYIHRDDLNRWIKSNRIISDEEMRKKEIEYEIFKGELSDSKRRKGVNH